MRTIIISKRLLALVLFLASAAVPATAADVGVEGGGCDAENDDGSCAAAAAAPVVQGADMASEALRLIAAVGNYGEEQAVEVSTIGRCGTILCISMGDFSSQFTYRA